MPARTSQPPGALTARAPVEVSGFHDTVTRAMHAFSSDVSYAVAMARAATAIRRKRALWHARRALKDAEADARAQCADTEPFDCHATAPCGVGDCKFAHDDLASMTGVAADGPHHRPQAVAAGPYSLDRAVDAYAERALTTGEA
jgi:Tfp pilus assembly protein PilX